MLVVANPSCQGKSAGWQPALREFAGQVVAYLLCSQLAAEILGSLPFLDCCLNRVFYGAGFGRPIDVIEHHGGA